MFILAYIGSGHFLGFKILNLTIFGVFFWVSTKLDYIYESLLCILGSFLKVKVQNCGYFLGC